MPRTKEEQKRYNAQYRLEKAEQIKEQRKAYRKANKDLIFQQKKIYRDKNRAKLIEKKRQDYLQNKEEILNRQKEKRRLNLEHARQRARERYHAKKEATRESRNAYARSKQKQNNEKRKEFNKKKRQSDPMFLVIGRLRSRIRSALNGYGWEKNKSTGEMLGCSREHFVKHIEALFTDGMGWHNRIEWHLDHIIPLASAKTLEEMEKLNHYTNLQPLWARENLSKGSRHES